MSTTDTAFCTRPWSVAEWIGAGTLIGAAALALFDPGWSVYPLAALVVLYCVLPFFPAVSFYFPVISRGQADRATVSLTFDDGPDPVVTPLVLELLARHGVPATFFVTGQRAHQYPQVIDAILAAGHLIGNHSYGHGWFIMFYPSKKLEDEIRRTEECLKKHGIRPVVFRPPVGILSPRYADVLYQTGLTAVTFSRRARDMGNRRIRGLARTLLKKIRCGDVILLHDVVPRPETCTGLLQEELAALLDGIKEKGLRIVPLDELLGVDVMHRLEGKTGST